MKLNAYWSYVYILGLFLTYVLEILDLLSLNVKLHHCNFLFGLSIIITTLQQKVSVCVKWFQVETHYTMPKSVVESPFLKSKSSDFSKK